MKISPSVTNVNSSAPVKLAFEVKVAPIGILVTLLEAGTVRTKRATDGVPRRRIAPRKGPSHSISID